MDPLAAAQMAANQAAAAPPVEQQAAWVVALWSVFSTFADSLIGKIDGAFLAVAQAQVQWVNSWITAALVLIWMVVLGGLFFDQIEVPIWYAIKRAAWKGAIVVTLLQQAPNYMRFIVTPLTNIPTEWSNAVAGAMGGGNFQGAQVFDHALDSAFKAAGVVWNNAPFLSIKGVFVMLVLAICMGVIVWCIARAFMVWLLAVLAVKLAIAFFPVFIAALAWERTRPWFDAWLGWAATGVVCQVLVVAILQILAFGEAHTTEQILITGQQAGANIMAEMMGVCVLAITSGLLSVWVSEMPAIASRLAGGIMGSVAPYSAALAGAAGGAFQGAAMGAKGATQAASATRRAFTSRSRTFVGPNMSG